ncbi:MAG: hypothetical protein AB8F94_23125 [Saprospiraceae bacterium]
MSTNQQTPVYNVHLKKAKNAINFVLVLFFFILLPVVFEEKFEQLFLLQGTLFLALFISARTIYKYPILAVITLGIMILFYLHGWYNFITQINLPNNAGFDVKDFLFYLILFLRIFTTTIVMRGFYFAIKGMIGKEQLEKRYETLDEDEM